MPDLLARYCDGQRDFQGADLRGARLQNAELSGVDLSGADLRGADFTGARLEGANLRGVRCGALGKWTLARGLLGLLVGGLSGLPIALTAMLVTAMWLPKEATDVSSWFGPSLVVLLMMVLWYWVRWGGTAVAVAFAVAVTVAVPIVSALAGPVAVVVVGGVTSAIPLAVAVAVAVAVAFAVVGAVAVAGAAAVAGVVGIAVAGALVTRLKYEPIAVIFTFLGAIFAQLVAIWLTRRRALAGSPAHVWVRDFAIATRGLGGTRFCGADLGQVDFCAADLHGADLRGADLDGTRFRDSRGLDWARFDRGDLRRLPVQRLLMSGAGAKHDFSGLRLGGLSLRGADLTGARLRETDLGGVDLTEARLDDAILDGARVDARTYVHSGWTPQILAELHKRGVEIVALPAFPPAAQDVIVGMRDGLVLSFGQPLTHFRQHLIEGSLYAIVGMDSDCRIAEYREKDDGTSFVRIVGADRGELERVAEAFYRRVWEETRTSNTQELARVNELLTDALRQRLSELVRDLVEIELRQPVATSAGSTALVRQGRGPAAASDPVWRWDQRADRVSFAGGRPRRLVILHAPSEIDTGLCGELLKHMEGLKGQGLLETFHETPPGEAVAATFATEIAEADVVLVLLSSDLLADAACQTRLQAALRTEKAAHRPITVPVVLRACVWEASSLGGRQCLPESGRPITDWGKSAAERDAGWVEVISALRRLLLSLSTTS